MAGASRTQVNGIRQERASRANLPRNSRGPLKNSHRAERVKSFRFRICWHVEYASTWIRGRRVIFPKLALEWPRWEIRARLKRYFLNNLNYYARCCVNGAL